MDGQVHVPIQISDPIIGSEQQQILLVSGGIRVLKLFIICFMWMQMG